jgi:hypothetical protein
MADVSYDIKDKSTDTLEIKGLDNIKAGLTLTVPQPIDTSSTLELKPIKADLGTTTQLTIEPLKLELQADPIKTDSSITLDLKPAVIDLCLTANIGKLPNVCIRQPYHHHIGFTLYGTEVWGLTLSGQQDTVIEELNRQPKVAWGGAVTSRPPEERVHAEPRTEPPMRESGALRIRLDR